jgi:alpha-tubulin suppressor-like RCC1 family protein
VTCAVAADGSLSCWGANTNGQLGTGGTGGRDEPSAIAGTTSFVEVSAAEGATAASCAIRDDAGARTLWCWGDNAWGLIAAGGSTEPDAYVPRQESLGATDWQTVDVGPTTACGVRSGGLWCWGDNSYGQLGVGTSADGRRYAPIPVGAANDWTDVAIGSAHVCGLRAGTLWCWGRNGNYQAQPGSTANVTSAAQVGALADWSAVAAGSYASCGLRAGGIFCWGANDAGQLGRGTITTAESSVAEVEHDAAWVALSAGGSTACGIDARGELWCWGRGSTGQLGPLLYAAASLPVRLGADSDWTSVSVGVSHSCGVRAGRSFCWGSDGSGQLGLDGVWEERGVLVPAPQ